MHIRLCLALRQRDMLGTSTDWLALQNDLEVIKGCSFQAFLHYSTIKKENFIKIRYQKCLSKGLTSLPWETLFKETDTLQVPLH